MKSNILSILFGFILLISCSSSDSDELISNNLGDDLSGELNLFPLALNPDFTTVSEATLSNSSLVGIVHFGSSVIVYPYPFVVHNEIINATFQGQKYAFSYCPITKSSVAFVRDQTFRASGYLYKNNLAPWDEKTESLWSQMLLQGIDGEKNGQRFNTIPVLETTWKTVKDFYPNAKVLSSNVFLTRSSSPPDDGDGSNSENSPESNELVFGIIDGGSVHIFKPSDFSNKIVNVTIQSQKYIVYGNSGKRVINAFKVNRFEDYTVLESDEFPYVLENSAGIKYDILGRGTNGSNLEKPDFAYVAIWEAWTDFYTNFKFQE
ncbi:MAG: DUF3179 domain-containing protein [Urechidicola sp.]|nr:DUF3179 domain-containing protein [Urechidicola sp.]